MQHSPNGLRQIFLCAAAAAALAACSPPASVPNATTETATTPAEQAVDVSSLPAGDYRLDKEHSSLSFSVDHMSFSQFRARFANFDAQLHLDPAHPEQAQLTATIDARSLDKDNASPALMTAIRGAELFNVAQFATMTFRSTAIERTGPNTARITGDFTMHGVTMPVTLEARFNGGYPGFQMDPHARIGFSAHGTLKRSEFGMGYGVPPPGSSMGTGDEVTFLIETEFQGPAWTPPPAR